MKNVILIGLLIIFAACSSNPGYEIEGSIESDFQGMVYLKGQEVYSYKVIDSVMIENGSFEFEGSLDFPDLYFISFANNKKNHMICLENADFEIVFKNEGVISEITGGDFQPLMNEFNAEMSVISEDERALINSIWKDTTITEKEKEPLYKDLASLREIKVELANSYIENNTSSPHTLMVLAIYIRNFLTIDELDSVYQTLTEDARKTNIGDRIGKSIIGTRQSATGKPMIDFSMPDVDGNDIRLSDMVKENKLVFIDFWASWCGPCRKSIPELKEIYADYHDKGLEFLAVSYDENRDEWIKAIEEEELFWPNVSNVEGWNCPTVQEYAITGIPASVLISQDGVIVARSLRGQELRDKIEEMLQ
jgi:thiol-disulfide isomerase/thioredoxin